MKRKLIEITQENSIECDTKGCSYVVKNLSGNPLESPEDYLNKPCPLCGNNLLTEKDYTLWLKTVRVIQWLNKWFSWILYLNPWAKQRSGTLKIHNEIDIKVNEDEAQV